MGTKHSNKQAGHGLGEALFSKTQRQLLSLLFGNPGRSFYAKEIVRYAGVGVGSVQRELEKLAAVNLLLVTQIGNQKHYQANSEAPIFQELRGIVLKTFGLADGLRTALAPLADRIHLAFIFGSVANASDTATSDIDLMIVGDGLFYSEVVTLLAATETQLGRTINPILYEQADFARKLSENNPFLNRVMDQPKIFLAGSTDDIAKPGKSG